MTQLGLNKTSTSTHSEFYPDPVNAAQPPPLPQIYPGGAPDPRAPPTSNPISRTPTKGGTRSVSKGGGTQVTLDETGSWSDLANRNGVSNSGPGSDDGRGGPGGKKASGMLGFLSRKRGRDRSPKPQEAGVLGKEGARVVVGDR